MLNRYSLFHRVYRQFKSFPVFIPIGFKFGSDTIKTYKKSCIYYDSF
ncbi:hypothetical protein LEP1GSC036_0642 [Leptospira weilii str. 2006001853]|uniref:Uncharacterized protein n=2 Tax=Leptospira weilii TaxID=28184 RepID=A0A828Z413_9LEPT|nr:hypothetical protein LEP1GSC036_0642 [Leptospira weilii str. 2006001853]EMM74883.1 hypothetical protein LEP1GSC038_0787 [Leptospira weilii str. 2006001855]